MLNISKNRRILVIDDDPDIRKMYNDILSNGQVDLNSSSSEMARLLGRGTEYNSDDSGPEFELDFASQGQEGFAMVQRAMQKNTPYALAFIDIRMPPGWDGLETAVQIRHVDSNLEFVFITAYSDKSRKEVVRKVGSPEKLLFLKKPFDPDELFQLALSLTEKWNLASQEALQRQELLQSEEKYRNLVQNTLDGFFIGQDGEIKFVNQAAIKMLGYSEKEELLGRTFLEFVSPEYSEIVSERFKALDRGEFIPPNHEIKLMLKDGSELLVDHGISCVMYEDRRARQCVIRDLTENRVANRVRQRLEAKAMSNAKLASLGKIATGIAHEINQPLTYIKIIFEAILRDFKNKKYTFENLAEESRESLRQIDRITKIINHLRTFGRDDDFLRDNVYLEEVLDNTLILMTEQMRLKNIVFKPSVQENLPVVLGDAVKLEQVLINLFQNSMDALAGMKNGVISILLYSEENQVKIRFRDNGDGIPGQLHARIFEPFFTTKEVGKGTGLGLAIVYGIIDEHQGSIEYDGGKNGASFLISLPIAQFKRDR